MRSIIYAIILLSSLCFVASGANAASVYLWTDKDGRMHITEDPPAKGGVVRDLIEYEPRTAPQPAGPSRRSDTAETKSSEKEAACRIVFKARRALRETKAVAAAVQKRAEEARDKVQDLRERIGFDDDELDDFKDDLRRLEENAHWAEMFAQQAELDVQVAELQVKLAETEADKDCPESY